MNPQEWRDLQVYWDNYVEVSKLVSFYEGAQMVHVI